MKNCFVKAGRYLTDGNNVNDVNNVCLKLVRMPLLTNVVCVVYVVNVSRVPVEYKQSVVRLLIIPPTLI
jgi:hypothetical protein